MPKHLTLLFSALLVPATLAQKADPPDEMEKLLRTAEGSPGAYIAIESLRPGLSQDETVTYRGFFISPSGLAVAPLHAFDSGRFAAHREVDGGPVRIIGVVAPDIDSGFAIVRTDQRPKSFLTLNPRKPAVKDPVGIFRARKDGGALVAPIVAIRKTPLARTRKYVEVLSLGANLGGYGGVHVPAGTPVFDKWGRVVGCLYAPSTKSLQRFLFALPASVLAARLPKNPAAAASIPFPLTGKLLPADPLALDAAYLYGRDAQLNRKYAEAERLLRKALARHPTSAAGWQRLGYVLRERGLNDEAMQAFIKAARFGNNLGAFLIDRADQYSQQGEVEEATEFLRSALEANSHDYDLHRAYAVALRAKKDEAGAEKHLRIALKLAPDALSCWSLLSKCLAAQGKWDAEKEASDKIYELEAIYRPR